VPIEIIIPLWHYPEDGVKRAVEIVNSLVLGCVYGAKAHYNFE
jgi:hypothetical protein